MATIRLRVVDAEVYAPLAPASGFRPGLAGDRPRAARVGATTDRAVKAYGLPPSSFGVGACPVQVHSRGLEFARGERRCSLRPLPSISPSAHPFAVIGRRPAGLSCTSRGFRRGPRMLTPRTWRRPPPWRSLRNQEVPTSGILCRLMGTDHRLQPTHRCLERLPPLLREASNARGFTHSASTASRPTLASRTSERCRTPETVS